MDTRLPDLQIFHEKPETLVKIERGVQHIQLEQLQRIKQILDVSYEELLEKKTQQ